MGVFKVDERQPETKPPFTLKDLRNAIPERCFKRSTAKSIGYVLHDFAFIAFFYYLSTFIDQPYVPTWAAFLLWPLYWFWQGNAMTGLWVIAHECGHRAFSDSVFICDLFGIVLHSALLVPYHSWRISHGKHHKNTNHLENDEVYIPETRKEVGKVIPFDELPAIVACSIRLWQMARIVIFGWPVYLTTHVTGRKYQKHTDHFNPWSPLFNHKERMSVIISDIALLAALSVIGYSCYAYGAWTVFKVFGAPYMWVNFWLTLITYLQHTDERLPHYREGEWTWLRGALATIDRDYGIMNYFHHNIGDTHVVHHLFSKMPHYNAMEATRAIRPFITKFYIPDHGTPGFFGVMKTFWTTVTYCRFVEDEGTIVWFKDR